MKGPPITVIELLKRVQGFHTPDDPEHASLLRLERTACGHWRVEYTARDKPNPQYVSDLGPVRDPTGAIHGVCASYTQNPAEARKFSTRSLGPAIAAGILTPSARDENGRVTLYRVERTIA